MAYVPIPAKSGKWKDPDDPASTVQLGNVCMNIVMGIQIIRYYVIAFVVGFFFVVVCLLFLFFVVVVVFAFYL
jgi:hypothetical protein